MPLEQEFIRAQQKRTAAAGRVEDAEFGDTAEDARRAPRVEGSTPASGVGLRALAQTLGGVGHGAVGEGADGGTRGACAPRRFIQELSNRLLDDVFDDVGGRVINAAGFLDFRLFLNNRAMAFRQPDDFAEKLLIDLSENVCRQRGKDIGAFWVVKAFENVPQELVVEIEAKGEFVGRFVAVLLRFEVEEAGIVAVVGLLELLSKARVNAVAVGQGLEASVILNAAAFADAQENDAVNDALDGEVEFALGELGIAQGEVAGQVGAPAFDGLQKFVVNVGCAALGFGGLSKLVERAFENGIAGEDAGDFVPAFGVVRVRNIENATGGGVIVLVGFEAAVIDGELLEICQDVE